MTVLPAARAPKLAVVVLVACAAATACTAPPEPTAISLIQRFEEATVHNAFTPEPRPPAVEWNFDGSSTVEAPSGLAATAGWKALHGVEGLRVRDGHLTGRATSVPILIAAAPEDLDPGDLLHAIEVRMRVSAGTRLGVSFDDDEEFESDIYIKGAKESALSDLNTELTPGEKLRTYTLTGADSSFSPSFPLSRIRQILIRPTDAEDAEFEIASVNLISRKEHLGTISSGIGWHGLGEIYRETIVSRSPERVSMEIDLPSEPFLNLAIGTVEDGPVTFRVDIQEGTMATTLLRRTVSTPGRWEKVPLDLADHAGRRITLSLGLESDRSGTIGFWGTPVIRNRAGRVAMDESTAARDTLTGAGAPPPQGVILIIADTLRSDHLEAYGHERATAPMLTRLAAEGTLFRDAIAQGTWTKVSVTSILTSLYPSTHGIKDLPDRIPASVTTLAEVYQQAGYATFATSSVPFTGKLTNLHQGVEVLHERSSIQDNEEYRSKTARIFVDRLLSWVEEHRDVPFFARLHAFDPHSPFEPYRPYDTLWMDDDRIAEHRENMEEIKEFIGSEFMKRQSLPKQKEIDASPIDAAMYVEAERDWYDASILAMDVEIGRLVEKLEEVGLADRTVIAFISDHGEEFLEHGNHFHGNNTYGEMINVPLILWGPGMIPAGLVVDETISSIDLMPTLLQLSRLPAPPEIQGQSLVRLMADSGKPSAGGWRRRPAFTERHIAPSDTRMERDEEEVESMAIVSEDWKLIRNTQRPEGWPEFELYDHREDPLNLEDVAADHPEVVERLAAELATWHEKALAAQVKPDKSTEGLSPEQIKRLRSLGYLQ